MFAIKVETSGRGSWFISLFVPNLATAFFYHVDIYSDTISANPYPITQHSDLRWYYTHIHLHGLVNVKAPMASWNISHLFLIPIFD